MRSVGRRSWLSVRCCQCRTAGNKGLNAGYYLLGVASVVGADPAIYQRNRRADRVGEVIPDQQSNLVAVVVGQECQKACSEDSWQ